MKNLFKITKKITNEEKKIFEEIHTSRKVIKGLLIINALFSVALALCIPTLCERPMQYLLVICGLITLSVCLDKFRKPIDDNIKALEKELFKSIGEGIAKEINDTDDMDT